LSAPRRMDADEMARRLEAVAPGAAASVIDVVKHLDGHVYEVTLGDTVTRLLFDDGDDALEEIQKLRARSPQVRS